MGRLAAPILCLVTCLGVAADWPSFRGSPAQDGVAADTLPDQLETLWQFKTGDAVENGAAVAGGVVYVGSFDEHLYALDLGDGRQKWKTKLGPIKAVPSVRGNRVYAGDVDGLFHAVDAAGGQEVWKFATEGGGEITSGSNFAGDRVLFGSHDQTLYCLDAAGKLAWKYAADGPIYGSPAVAGNKTFVVGCDSKLHIVDVGTGKEVGSVDLGGQTGASAAVAGDRAFVGTMSNHVLGIDLKKPEVAWRYESARRRQPFYSSPAVTDKLAIIGSRDRRVVALDRATGDEKWSFETGNRVDGSPVVAGGRVYVGSLDGHFYVLGLDDGKQIQKIKLDGPVSASPAVVAGRLVIATQAGTVYCLGKK